MHANACQCMLMHMPMLIQLSPQCDVKPATCNMCHNHSPFCKYIAMLAVGIEEEDIEVENVLADVKK